MGKLPSLVEAFRFVRRKIREANLDIEPFTRAYGHETGRKGPVKPRPDSQGQSMADLAKHAGIEKEKPPEKSGTGVKYEELVPQPHTGDGMMQAYEAQELGLKKITNFYLSPKHWEKSKPNAYGAVNWEGTDWIQPKTPEAKKLADRIERFTTKAKDILKSDVWKKHFEKEFGPQR